MFTYINPDVRKKLIARNKLVRIDEEGRQIDSEGASPAGQRSLNLLGPVPLPLARGTNQPMLIGTPLFAAPNYPRSKGSPLR